MLLFPAVAFIINLRSVSLQYCSHDVKNILTSIVNTAISKYASENASLQKGICTVSYDGGNIRSISIDPSSVSVFTAGLSTALSDVLTSFDGSKFGIPLGNAFGLTVLSGRGPRIKIKTMPLGNIACGTESEFISAGINQTVFRLTLRICCAYSILSPFESAEGELYFTYTLCETVIVGDVPKVYFGG